MSTSRMFHTATLLPNGKVLIAGGNGFAGYLDSAELYDPTAVAFAPAGRVTAAREDHTATLLPSGMVLIAGGANRGVSLASAELYE